MKESYILRPTESQLVNSIIRRCWIERAWLTVWRTNAGRVKTATGHWVMLNKAGLGDVTGYFSPLGRFVTFEAKVKANDQEDTQMDFEADCVNKGAYYFLIRSMEDLEKSLASIRPAAVLQ